MHEDQLRVSPDLACRLVADQLPHLGGLQVRQLPGPGTVNAVFRLGDTLTARFPLVRQDLDSARSWLATEQAAARELAAVCPVPTPEPVALGEPGHGYPMPWSVQTWLPGEDASRRDPGASVAFAEDLAEVVLALRSAGTRGRRFTGPGRGGHLPDHDPWVQVCLTRSAGLLDVRSLAALWERLRELPRTDPDVMCHGDLIAPNVLVGAGDRLAGVLDGGGFGPADPALELAAAWHLLDSGPREALRRRVGCDDVQWGRGMAWALVQALGSAWYYAETNPVMSDCARRTLDRLLEAGGG